MPQALKIGNSVFQVDDAALGTAIENHLTKYDSLSTKCSDIQSRLDAAENARATLDAGLSEAKASLDAANAAKVQADAEIAALQSKLDAAEKKLTDKEAEMLAEGKSDPDEKDELKKSKTKKMDSDEIKSYCKEFLTVVSEVTPSLKKIDSAFEPDFGLSPLDYKAQYLKTIDTLPADAKARIDSTGDERDMFVEHLYIALKPQVAETSGAPAKADEGNQQLIDSINQNRGLTLDAGDKKGSYAPKEDSPTMKARKERKLPSAYSSK